MIFFFFWRRDECTFVILKYRPIRKFVFFKFLNSMIRIWIVLLVVEIHLSLLRESCFLLASFWNPDCLHLELTQKIWQEIFWTTWCQILKKSELFHVPPKIQRASRWNIIFIISNLFYHFVPFVYNNVERSKIRIWIKWTFFPITCSDHFWKHPFVIESRSWSVSSRECAINNFQWHTEFMVFHSTFSYPAFLKPHPS